MEKKLEMRSIPRKEFEKYLGSRANKIENDIFYGENWQVTLSKEYPIVLGKFKFSAVDVFIEAEAEIFENFLFTFQKNFSRGGG